MNRAVLRLLERKKAYVTTSDARGSTNPIPIHGLINPETFPIFGPNPNEINPSTITAMLPA